MNILFYGTNASDPTLGGIARISNNLLCYFNSMKVHSIAIGRGTNKPNEAYQFFFPSPDLYDETNRKYLENLILKHQIDVIINQSAICMQAVDFLFEIKQKYGFVKIVSCIHNPLLNQIINYPYLIEHKLKSKHLYLIFIILSLPWLKYVYKTLGILIRKRQYSLDLINKRDVIMLLSPGHMKELIDIVGIKNANKVKYIPNCISLDNINTTSKENIVLWIGTVDTSIKRIDNMLIIWKEFSKKNCLWKLYVLGDGPDLQWAINYTHKQKIKNVFFKGRVNPIEYYKKAKVSCITSSYESFSMVIVESFKYGVVPIVNNSFPSASYLIEDGFNGFLPDEFDSKAFVKVLKYITSSDTIYEQMRINCIESATKFSTQKIGKKWLDLIKTL